MSCVFKPNSSNMFCFFHAQNTLAEKLQSLKCLFLTCMNYTKHLLNHSFVHLLDESVIDDKIRQKAANNWLDWSCEARGCWIWRTRINSLDAFKCIVFVSKTLCLYCHNLTSYKSWTMLCFSSWNNLKRHSDISQTGRLLGYSNSVHLVSIYTVPGALVTFCQLV